MVKQEDVGDGRQVRGFAVYLVYLVKGTIATNRSIGIARKVVKMKLLVVVVV